MEKRCNQCLTLKPLEAFELLPSGNRKRRCTKCQKAFKDRAKQRRKDLKLYHAQKHHPKSHRIKIQPPMRNNNPHGRPKKFNEETKRVFVEIPLSIMEAIEGMKGKRPDVIRELLGEAIATRNGLTTKLPPQKAPTKKPKRIASAKKGKIIDVDCPTDSPFDRSDPLRAHVADVLGEAFEKLS